MLTGWLPLRLLQVGLLGSLLVALEAAAAAVINALLMLHDRLFGPHPGWMVLSALVLVLVSPVVVGAVWIGRRFRAGRGRLVQG
jgi:hypothetical protein